MVGNSRVEEHISKQALADVYELEQHSQDPANLVENKLEVSTTVEYAALLYGIIFV